MENIKRLKKIKGSTRTPSYMDLMFCLHLQLNNNKEEYRVIIDEILCRAYVLADPFDLHPYKQKQTNVY
jgi:hypothetical protein